MVLCRGVGNAWGAGCSKYGFRAYRTISSILRLLLALISNAVGWLTRSFQPLTVNCKSRKHVPGLPARKYVLRTSSAIKGTENLALVALCRPLQAPSLPSPPPALRVRRRHLGRRRSARADRLLQLVIKRKIQCMPFH
jgi:hypothetical protein